MLAFRMLQRSYKLLFGLLIFVAGNVFAATVTVEPGLDTLRAAVKSASEGDILVLQDGDYRLSSSADLVINKSLTIRAINAAANPRVYFISGGYRSLEISGDSTDFVMQGVQYYSNVTQTYFRVKGNVASTALLENTFSGIHFNVEQTTDSDNNIATVDQLLFVGNTINSSYQYNGSLSNLGAEKVFLFAGNRVNYMTLNTQGFGAVSHIIGNRFVGEYGNTGVSASGNDYVRIIGNTFLQNLSSQTGANVSNRSYPVVIYTYGGQGEILNNVVIQGANPFSATGTPSNFKTIYISGKGWTIANNLFEMVYPMLNDTGGNEEVFNVSGSVEFKNNIIKGSKQSKLFEFYDADAQRYSQLLNNLCFDTVSNCPEGNGNISGKDPKFLDRVDYKLAADSPAKDAGVVSDVYKDIDGSIADLGPQGGVFPIEQFSKQILPGVTAPYFYPLFEANSSLANTGELTVKAVAIARQR